MVRQSFVSLLQNLLLASSRENNWQRTVFYGSESFYWLLCVITWIIYTATIYYDVPMYITKVLLTCIYRVSRTKISLALQYSGLSELNFQPYPIISAFASLYRPLSVAYRLKYIYNYKNQLHSVWGHQRTVTEQTITLRAGRKSDQLGPTLQ